MPLTIQERTDGGQSTVLKVSGELDLSTAASFSDAVRCARARKRAVRLDLSELDFIDSSGARAIERAVAAEPDRQWLQLDPNLSLAAQVLFGLIEFEPTTLAA